MRLHALQYLRAVAALAVVYSHTVIQVEDYYQYLVEAGSFGVDIFFVISGFIMIYISKPGDTPSRFFINRVRRVVPLYWFFTVTMAIILIIMPTVFKTTVFDWEALLLSLVFVPHFSVAQAGVVWPIVAPGWSLNYEMYFYLIFAASLVFTPKYRVFFIAAVITSVFLLANTGPADSAVVLFYSESIVFEFVFGMLLAVAWKSGFRQSPTTGTLLVLLGSAMLLLRLPVPRILEFGLPALLVVAGCLFVRVREYPWLVLLGDASYALYLSHIFTLGVLRKLLPPLLGTGPLAAYLFVVISLVTCMVASVFVHRYIDNWLLRNERFCAFLTTKHSEA